MKYWLTTHWPPRKGEENKYGTGIWLKDGQERFGKDINKGDFLLIYESKTGRVEERFDANGNKIVISCHAGRQGIVEVGKIKTLLYAYPNKPKQKYTDGTEAWWRWHAESSVITKSGFVSRTQINKVLNFKTNYVYKGFGAGHTGLSEITKSQFEELISLFKQPLLNKMPIYEAKKRHGHGTGEESVEHRELKNYVAQNPSKVLGEEGLVTIDVESSFPTNDRADIVLEDKYGRIIGTEIEVEVNDGDEQGPLQSIKYRRMLEWMFERSLGDSRSFLVANKISKKIIEKCKKYEIECFEIIQN